MRTMLSLIRITFLGGVRDRILYGVFIAAILMILSTPLISSFSMRDVSGVALTYSLSLVSAVGVLLVIFTGGTLIARDIQSRTIYSVATLSISRAQYIVGKYLGFAGLLFCVVVILGACSFLGVSLATMKHPPDIPVNWLTYVVCLLFGYVKLLLLSAVLMLFASFATSTFLPMILTFAVYAIGESTEQVKFFIETAQGGKMISPFVKAVTVSAYYLFPNLALFDLKTQATYALSLDMMSLGQTLIYGIGYSVALLVLACYVFDKRDFV